MDFEASVSDMDERTCSGCGLCAFVCPVDCIQMEADPRGFLVPKVSNGCIGCGACRAACPVLHLPFASESDASYAARARSRRTLMSATAGGVFLPLAETVLQSGGRAYGAVIDDDLMVNHRKCSTLEEAARCAGSKYVQSSLVAHDVFGEIRNDLDAGRRVLFSGLPCQTAAVRQRFGDDPRVITVDLVCHGVASPLAWMSYLRERNPGEIASIAFRNKTFGYHFSTMKIRYSDRVYSKSGRLDPFLKAFFSGVTHREICTACPFKGEKRYSDITLFDCSQFTELTGLADDGEGYTNILVNTEKGEALLGEAEGYLWLKETRRSRAIELNGRMVCGSTPLNSRTPQFYERLALESFTNVVESLYPTHMADYVTEAIKGPLNRLGILDRLREVKRRLGC